MENETELIELTEDQIIVENNIVSSGIPKSTQGEKPAEDIYEVDESYENDG